MIRISDIIFVRPRAVATWPAGRAGLIALGMAAALALTPAMPVHGQTGDDFTDAEGYFPDVPVRPLADLLREAGEPEPDPERIPLVPPPSDRATAPAMVPDTAPVSDSEPLPAAAPAAPPVPGPVWQARAGLRVQVPPGLVWQFDDPELALLSDGASLELMEGFYVILFAGSEAEAEGLLTDSGWQIGAARPYALVDGTAMQRHVLNRAADGTQGRGLWLSTVPAPESGRLSQALILAVDRPDIDPEAIAATLATVDPSAPDRFGPLPPEAPQGWVRQVRLGLSLALPPGFEVLDEARERLALARGADAAMLAAPTPPPGVEAMVIGLQPLRAEDLADEPMPVLARGELRLADGAMFRRLDVAAEGDGTRMRGVVLQSEAADRRNRRIGLSLIALNPADEAAALAEIETILATLRLNPSSAFPRPLTALSALDGLFDVSLAGGWQSRFSAPGYRMLASSDGIAILQAGLPARVALTLTGFAGPPAIRDGVVLGVPSQIAEGRASTGVDPMGGHMVLIVPDRCLVGGEPIAITLSGPVPWDEAPGLRAFLDGLRMNLPQGHVTCRPVLGTVADTERAPPDAVPDTAPAVDEAAPIEPMSDPAPEQAPEPPTKPAPEREPEPATEPPVDPVAQLRADAAAGDGAAMLDLARRLDLGLGMARDPRAALDWYYNAAEAGQVEAMLHIAQRHRVDDGVEPNQALAVYWYRAAAEAGNLTAMVETGRYLARGQGVARDDAQAVTWYRRAAEGGNTLGMTMLAWMLADGRGTERDDAAALVWLQRAADGGLAMAQNHLGVMYRDGRGVRRNLPHALGLFEQAANGGDAQGMMNLAFALSRGEGGPQDPRAAASWLMAALIAGNSAVVDHVLARLDGLPAATMREVQIILEAAGFNPGGVDGRAGSRTRAAVQAWVNQP